MRLTRCPKELNAPIYGWVVVPMACPLFRSVAYLADHLPWPTISFVTQVRPVITCWFGVTPIVSKTRSLHALGMAMVCKTVLCFHTTVPHRKIVHLQRWPVSQHPVITAVLSIMRKILAQQNTSWRGQQSRKVIFCHFSDLVMNVLFGSLVYSLTQSCLYIFFFL